MIANWQFIKAFDIFCLIYLRKYISSYFYEIILFLLLLLLLLLIIIHYCYY